MAITPIGRRGSLGLAALAVSLNQARAAPAIDRTARIVVGTPAGGGEDILARLLAGVLSGAYAPTAVVENRPGASNRLAVEAVKAAAPDGTSILMAPLPVMALFPHIFPRTTRYDGLVDFIPVCTVASLVHGWVVRADHPARDLVEFLAWARGRGSATFAPPVIGSPPHMLGTTVGQAAGVALTAVSYRGGAPALQDLLAGQIDSVISHMGDLVALLRAGQTRLIALNTQARLAAWPDTPTFTESGFGTLPTGDAIGLFLPARTPMAIVTALHGAIDAAVTTTPVREGLTRLEMMPLVLSPAATADRIRSEHARWAAVVRAIGFSAE